MASPRFDGPSSLPIPGRSPTDKRMNALAGPSSEGAIQRRTSVSSSPPKSPSSAPPTPSVISVTHPSPFIHTHHPRRGSMTPLGLNLISPVSPFIREPARQTGFNTNNELVVGPLMNRRGSTASTTSTLTQSRPTFPPNFNPGRRRSSLTPVTPVVAPTRTHVSGRASRPTSSEGQTPSLRSRTRTAEASTDREEARMIDNHGRRGSMPHLGHGRGQPRWNPVLPPPRGSFGDDGHIFDQGFKFGSSSNAVAGPSAATAALRAVDSSRRQSRDAFAQAEDDEADRQRRAFLAATYGEDGRRARERLSIGGASTYSGSPGTPGATLRRQSLMLWERMGMAPLAGDDAASMTAHNMPPPFLAPALDAENYGPRRGSLPVAIPGGGIGRSPSRRSARGRDMEVPSVQCSAPDETEEEDTDEDDDDEPNNLSAPKRPLPPLLPLSDPGPRLLPSTLALHRANHLLTSRNLQSEPLPHPLPPSLHPPAPVDVAEFDIDFILAGSMAQLGKKAQSISSLPMVSTPILKVGGDEEDTFAKFVGEFDDEYGGRRGEWTFRACGLAEKAIERSPRDPLDKSGSARPIPKAEWESSGAGKYELFANGEVRSAATGRSWRVSKLGPREYELEEQGRAAATGLSFGGESYCLADKAVHRDQGGVKLPHFSAWLPSGRSSSSVPTSTNRSSISGIERTLRLDSEDSTVTMTPHKSQTAAAVAAINKPARKRQSSRDEEPRSKSRPPRSTKDSDAEKKSIGSMIKRGFLSSIKNTSLGGSQSSDEKRVVREERERERQQAHTWSGGTVHHSSWSHGINPREHVRAPATERSASTSMQSSSSRSATSGSSEDSRYWYASSQGKQLSSDDEARGLWQEGLAWKGIPDDAVAMIVPLDPKPQLQRPPLPGSHPLFTDGPKQALLVWYVPFNADGDDSDHRSSTASSRASVSDQIPPPLSSSPVTHGSLPKFQKLLRRRASKDKDALKRETAAAAANVAPPSPGRFRRQTSSLHPLPFRSFRVVARVVDTHDLRSEHDSASGTTSVSVSSASSPFDKWQKDQNPFSTHTPAANLPPNNQQTGLLPSVDETTSTAAQIQSQSKSMQQSELDGRNFPTVIAVCHSRSQGVEFVLEGLDRLGLCKGDSAWGPTGYEEWRGTGLSEQGRELLDLLWAGCTGVMGLSAV